jgi:head-tail adaptor
MKRPIPIGLLRQRATLLAPVRTADLAGGAALGYAAIATVWAFLEGATASPAVVSGRAVARHRARLILRTRTDIKPGWQAHLDGRTWRVEGIIRGHRTEPFQYLTVTEVAP